MGACDATSLWVTILATVFSIVVWGYWKPHIDPAFKLGLKLIFASYVWNFIYVAWIAAEIEYRWPDWYNAAPMAYEFAPNLLFVVGTWFVLDELGKYMGIFIVAAIIMIITKHLYLGGSLGIAFAAGLALHFALRSSSISKLGSIVVISLASSAAISYGSVSLAVHGGTSDVFSLHRQSNPFLVNQTLPLFPPRGTNCTAQAVNMILVCDSHCPVIGDMPEQPIPIRLVTGLTVSLFAVRMFGILFLKGYKDVKTLPKGEEEEGEEDKADKEDEDKPLCHRCKLCCNCFDAWCKKRRSQQQQQQQQQGYERVVFTGVT